MRPLRALKLVGLALCATIIAFAGYPGTYAHLRAASLLVRASGSSGWLARLYDTPIVEENLLLHTADGPFRARIYRPREGGARRGLVLAHGVHYMGIDEPRLIPFARNLAHAGLVVMMPELNELADYRIHISAVDEIRVAVRALAARPEVRRDGVGVLGLSFAGGLALVAAEDPATRAHVAFIAALGGHNDLRRVSRFLATDQLETSHGVVPMHAHDYGLIVFFYAHAEAFVSGEQLWLFRDALRQMLHLDRAAARRAAVHLEGDARTLFDHIDANDKAYLAPRVVAALPALRDDMAALSPTGHLGALRGVPVFILHGAADDVMPPSEAEANARELGAVTSVMLLLSPNIKHVTIEGTPTAREQWRILHIMAAILGT